MKDNMNDVIYNEMVLTPGFELEFAVGTTYSLNVEAFFAITMVFAGLGEANESDYKSPLRFLEGLRQANRKMAVFCNRGGLQLPRNHERSSLCAMLDKSVFEVPDGRKGKELANFHPKIWVIKERSLDNPEVQQIKLLVMSCNLTKSTDLDVAVSMTAEIKKKVPVGLQKKHEPLKIMLEELANRADENKKKEIKKLAKEIDRLGAFELGPQFEDYDFFPLWFGKNLNEKFNKKSIIEDTISGQKMIIVSPFIDKGMLEKLNDYNFSDEKILITRKESLTRDIWNLYDDDKIWVPSQIKDDNGLLFNLHAKMYFSQESRAETSLWVGSANATQSGFHRNTEFLLRLKYKSANELCQNFKKMFCDGKRFHPQNDFEDIELIGEDERIELEKEVRRFLNTNELSAQVVQEKGETYKIVITAERPIGIDGIVWISPFQMPKNKQKFAGQRCELKATKMVDLSEFYVLSVKSSDGKDEIEMVIKIPTNGIPEERDNTIVRTLIPNKETFLEYVNMMLTDEPYELSAWKQCSGEVSNKSKNHVDYHYNPMSIYESMLKIAATKPEQIKKVKEFVEDLSKDEKIVPLDFTKMMNVFDEALIAQNRTVKKKN